MPVTSEVAQRLQEQVSGKVHWGASPEEIYEWLSEKHGIEGSEADQLFEIASRERRAAIRGRAIMWLVISSVGVLAFCAFVFVQWSAGFVLVGLPVLIAYFIGIVSVGVLIRSLIRLATGRTSTNVD